MASDQVFHVGIAQRPRDSKDTVNTVVQDQTTSIRNTATLVFVTALVVIGEAQRSPIATQDNAGIADICSVEDPLPASVIPELRLDGMLRPDLRLFRSGLGTVRSEERV